MFWTDSLVRHQIVLRIWSECGEISNEAILDQSIQRQRNHWVLRQWINQSRCDEHSHLERTIRIGEPICRSVCRFTAFISCSNDDRVNDRRSFINRGTTSSVNTRCIGNFYLFITSESGSNGDDDCLELLCTRRRVGIVSNRWIRAWPTR